MYVYVYVTECGCVTRALHSNQIRAHHGCRPDRGRAVTQRIGKRNILLSDNFFLIRKDWEFFALVVIISDVFIYVFSGSICEGLELA